MDPLTAQKVEAFNLASRKLSKNLRLDQVRLVAVDFETTGLAADDQIISMGFCPITNGIIRLADCKHILVKSSKSPSNKSVTIHGLTHDQIDTGLPTESSLMTFLDMCHNAIVIAHYHKIERQYIQSLTQQITGKNLILRMLDTFVIAKTTMERRHQAITPASLRLFNLRQNYGLPSYKAHNALEDAISTAELFIAQMKATNEPINQLKLRDFGLLEFKN